MTKTAVGAEEPDENKPVTVPATVTFTNGAVTVTYESNSVGMLPLAYTASTGDVRWIGKSKTSVEPAPTVLFGDWIEKTKYLQEGFYGHKFEDFTQEELEQWVRTNVLAAEDELHEALGEISWKPWASSQFFNREAYLGEIVDVLHFIGNLLAGAQITDEELNAAYLEKMERNRKRQTQGYTGVDKCIICKRAVDDIEAHSGRVTWSQDGSNPRQALCEECEGRM